MQKLIMHIDQGFWKWKVMLPVIILKHSVKALLKTFFLFRRHQMLRN